MKVAESIATVEAARQLQKQQGHDAHHKHAAESGSGLLVTIGVLLLAILSAVALAYKGP